MNRDKFRYIRRGILICLLVLVLAIRFAPYGGELYATTLYPAISQALSYGASFCPWSLEEILVAGALCLLVLYPLIALLCRRKWTRILAGEIETLGWLYVWFYLGWGSNYFRTEFHERLMIRPEEYDAEVFGKFLNHYTNSLNAAWHTAKQQTAASLHPEEVHREVKRLYSLLPPGYGLTCPKAYQQPKRLLFNNLYSQVGVLGYMGPFFGESQLNEELPEVQYPFTYAHELSHLLGISSEAEANFWAYIVCTHSNLATIRYSGYFGLLSYVRNNARQVLTEEEYARWESRIEPAIQQERAQVSAHWQARYNPVLGELQDLCYDWYLKGNDIASGRKNYAEVIGMLISAHQSQEEPLRRRGARPSIRQ